MNSINKPLTNVHITLVFKYSTHFPIVTVTTTYGRRKSIMWITCGTTFFQLPLLCGILATVPRGMHFGGEKKCAPSKGTFYIGCI